MSEMNPPRCTRCGRTMERGLILDRSRNRALPSTWMEGEPERSLWFGLKTDGRERHEVISFRCEGCGYLESYAPASPDTDS